MNYAVVGFLFILLICLLIALVLHKLNVISRLKSLIRREKAEEAEKPKEEVTEIQKILPEDTSRELGTRLAQLEERVRQMVERAKKAEEAYSELKTEHEKIKKEKEELEKKIEEKDKEIEEMLRETNKLVKWMAMRFNRGEYVPVVMWTRRGNPMLLKFVCGIAYINGGWRALLVNRLTDKPSRGEWYPPLDKPGAMFIFRDQPGFDPSDPSHTVLFDISLRDWEEDLKITKSDPKAKPVGFVFGVDEDGNPVHKLEFGVPIDIRKLRQENMALKRENGYLRYRISKLEEQIWDLRHQLEVEKDRKEFLERELKLTKAKLVELEEVYAIQSDESEILRNYARSLRRREYAFRKRFKDLEEEYLAEVMTPTLKGIPGYEYLEKIGRERAMKIISKLYPIAINEADMYGIDTIGKSMDQVVKEWLRAKWEKDHKDLSEILEEYRLLDEVADILRGEAL